jgi:hypothetical protein
MAKLLESNPVCCGLWGCRCSGAGATLMCTQHDDGMAFIPFYAPLQRVSCDPGAAGLRASTHPQVVKIGCNVVMSKFSSIDPAIERSISSRNVPSRTSNSPPPSLLYLTSSKALTSPTPPSPYHLSSRLQVLAHESDRVPSTAYSVTQEQNIYDYDVVSSIGAGEEGRRIS